MPGGILTHEILPVVPLNPSNILFSMMKLALLPGKKDLKKVGILNKSSGLILSANDLHLFLSIKILKS